MERSQMTFFVSFWDAINGLSKKDQLPLFRAVIQYGLFGEQREALTASQSALFSLMRPVIDNCRKKSANAKQNRNKQEANRKQTGNDKENENEIENEIENESYKGAAFDQFWQAYPRKEGKQKAIAAFERVTVALPVLLEALEKQKKSAQWVKDGGVFIPHPATWLNGKRWEDELLPDQSVPNGATGQLGKAELDAIERLMGGADERISGSM